MKKILVATKLPCKQCVVERAKAMKISLIILDKDINKFRNSIKNAILNSFTSFIVYVVNTKIRI